MGASRVLRTLQRLASLAAWLASAGGTMSAEPFFEMRRLETGLTGDVEIPRLAT
jgi:hypothetical protein